MYIFAIVLLAAIFFGRTLFPGTNEIIYGGDLLSQFYYWKGFYADNLRQGIIPFWNPYNFSGTPFLAHPAIAPFYPGTLLFLIFPLNFAFSFNYFLHLVIGGFGLFLLSKRYADSLSSFFAAAAFMLSGFISSRIYAGHFDLLTTAVWIPWVIYSFLGLADYPTSRQNIIRTIIYLSALILAGYSAYLVFTLELLFFLLIYRLIKKPPQYLNILISFSLAVVFSLGITSIQWLPTWQLAQNSIRGHGMPYELASWGSLPLSGLKLFFNPLDRVELNKISFNLGGGPRENPFDHFIGRTPLAVVFSFIVFFFISKLLVKKKYKININSEFWFFSILCLYFLLIAFGNNLSPSLHYLLYRLVPFYRYIRIPMQNLIIPVVLIPVMTGMILSKIRPVLIKTVIGIVLVSELMIFGKPFIFLTSVPMQKHDPSIINKISKSERRGRILPAFRVISPILDRFDINASMLYRFQSTSGYDPVILKNYYDFIDSANGNNVSSLPLYNVEIPPINLGKKTADLLNVNKILNDDGSIVENKNSLPRFYFSKDDSCHDENKGIELIEYFLNKIILKTSNKCPAILMSSEVYYPGWKAKIDGKNTGVYVSNNTFRTINIPKGNHIVEYYYYPYIYILGLIISLSSLLSLFIILNSKFLYSKFLIHDS